MEANSDSKFPDLKRIGHGFSEKPRVLLVAPCITIPAGMPKRCIPPLGISYLAASLQGAGYDVAMYDCSVEGYEDNRLLDGFVTYGVSPKSLAQKLRHFDPHVIGVSVMFSTDLVNALEICCECKKIFHEVPI